MSKRRQMDAEEAGRAVQQMLRQLQNNSREIARRSDGNERTLKLCRQLDEFSTNLLEWGFHRGNIEIWASFVPSMFDYPASDEEYGENE